MHRLADFEPVLKQLVDLLVKRADVTCRPVLSEILRRHPKLIVALNHSTPLSWVPAVSVLAAHACARGHGHRIPIGIMDRAFFHIPLLKIIAAAITQSREPQTFSELVERFDTAEQLDLVVFPEGSNCFFGDHEGIQEFRSPKFIELAVRSRVPILLGVHRGSEHWAKSLPISGEQLGFLELLPPVVAHFLESRLKRTGRFVLPLLPQPMERFQMHLELYFPSGDSPLEVEAEKIRSRMQAILDEMKQREAARSLEMNDEKSKHAVISGFY